MAWARAAPASEQVSLSVDWSRFLGKHDFHWEGVPADWWSGAFVGNGLLGAMIHREGDRSLVWELGRSDVYDHRHLDRVDWLNAIWFRSRLPVGSMRLVTRGRILGASTTRLDLWNAEAGGVVVTEQGRIAWRSFVHAVNRVVVVELNPDEGERDCAWQWVPAEARTSRTIKRPKEPYPNNPEGVLEKRGDMVLWRQPLLAGGDYVTAWRETTAEPGRRWLCVSVGYTQDGSSAAEAVRAVHLATETGVETMSADHRAWWHTFYSRHFLSVPDARLEGFYWKQIYKLGCAMRADGPICDLFGPWFKPSQWPALWWNLNVQFTYYPVYAANLLPLGESLTAAIDRSHAALRANAGPDFPDSMAIGRASGLDLRADVQAQPYEVGNLPWVLHNYWCQYRYSMDETLLRERLLPLLRQSANYYLRLLRTGTDGRLHLPATLSPEYGTTADCTYDMSLLRWQLQTLIGETVRLGLDEPLLPRWREVLDHLVPLPTDARGFRIGGELGFERPHHHYSHLLAIFPLRLVRWSNPADRPLIETSVRRYLEGNHGQYQNLGAAAMLAGMGEGDDALPLLQEFVQSMTTPNTFINADGNACIEAPFHFNRSLQEVLLQSDDREIRVFPAIPSSWSDAVIHSLRTEGAFLISARRRRGVTTFVQVTSLAGGPCRLRSDLVRPIRLEGPTGVKLHEGVDGALDVVLARGETVLLRSAGLEEDPTVGPVSPDLSSAGPSLLRR
ncbi:MAG: hypothetical protein U1F61_03240 [Opitutaceae bacterium]